MSNQYGIEWKLLYTAEHSNIKIKRCSFPEHILKISMKLPLSPLEIAHQYFEKKAEWDISVLFLEVFNLYLINNELVLKIVLHI